MSFRPRALLAFVLSLLFVASGASTAAAQGGNGPPEDSGSGQDGPSSGNGNGNGTGGDNGTDDDATAANETNEPPRRESTRDRVAAMRERLTGLRLALERAPGLEAKQAEWRDLSANERRGAGMFFFEDGVVVGTFVSFQPDLQRNALLNVTMKDGTVLFEEIWLPVDSEPVRAKLNGNALQIRGEDWEFRITDTQHVPIRMEAEDGRSIIAKVPADTIVQPTDENILQLAYPLDDQRHTAARFVHDAAVDPADPYVIIVEDGKADFSLTAERVLLGHIANKVRPDLDAARARGTLGAELTVLRAGGGLYRDAVLYDDMLIDLASGTATGEPVDGSAYTITVDAALASGRTIAVTFEAGLVDPQTLALRYFNVDGARTLEGPIPQASGIHDILDPSDDGTVAEYWVVEDIDGTQLLLSIPHFSVHKIELLSMIEVERPALIAGILGAVILVGVATRALIRRPQLDR